MKPRPLAKTAVRSIIALLILLGIATLTATAQTTVNPTTSTTQFAGTPIAQSPVTAPTGGVVLSGTATSLNTGQPVRHLWVADSTAGLCRMDPDIDSPGPYAINSTTCLTGSGVLGGGMAFDATTNFLYFADNQKTTRGVLRVTYLPGGNSGQGSLDPASLFDLGGNQAGGTFAGGQTGCALPNNPGPPNAAALDPLGNLWVGFAKNSEVLRFNNVGAASPTNFGTCTQFIQVVATVASNRVGTGLAWIGHDLWGANSQSLFFIHNADTTCLVGSNPACNTTNGLVVPALSTVSGAASLASDQVYPAINGNNLYVGLAGNDAWVGNVAGGSSGQTLTLTYIDVAQATVANVGAVTVDGNDPANLVLYSGDDPSGLATPGAGRWWQTIQTAAAPGPPGTPLDVIAVGGTTQATVSWSPAQVAQPVTSYTVHNSFASNGLPVGDVTVTPAGGGLYPPTSTIITGLANNVTYQFQVLASNAQGSSSLSASSNQVQAVSVPLAPSGVHAIAGDQQATVSWTAPSSTGGLPLTSYTVTALVNGVATGIATTVSASSTSTAVTGLTDGTTYTFTVHASNSVGDSPESAPSNAVTPTVPVVSVTVTGPYAMTNTPMVVAYKVTVTNISALTVTSVAVNNTLSTTDGAYIIAGQSAQATCAQGGVGITSMSCSVGSLVPGASATMNVVAQMPGAAITLSSGATGNDGNGNAFVLPPTQRTTLHGNAPSGTPVVSVSLSVNAVPSDVGPGKPGTITWNLQNTTGVAANRLILAIVMDNRMAITGVAVTGSNSTDPVSCDTPSPGIAGTNLITCNMDSLGGSSSGSGSTPVTALQVVVNYNAPPLTPLTLAATGYLSFDGTDSSNPIAATSVRVK